MAWLEPIELAGERVTLQPLAERHAADLAEAIRDGELWKLWYTGVPTPDAVPDEIGRRLALQAAGEWLPFAVVDPASGRAVGMTGYLNVVAKVRRLEIGGTWIRRGVQRTGLNVEAKLLLLRHAFETLDCIAVELRTSSFNQQSRRAIEGLGAKLDGILRNHYDGAGNMRDTCVYSIIPGEWPLVKRHLQWRLDRYGVGGVAQG
ncbi:MAG: GNAT family protein [Caulobacteraceae bacterium]